MQPKHKAMLHFILEPYKRTSWGGAMNGQAGRIRLFRDIFSVVQPSAIIETGTFIGATTKFFAEFGVPVYSVEADERVLAVAKRNTRHVRDRVAFTLSDSRSFLRKLVSDPQLCKSRLFFYLDAHWNADLPLADEINIIFDACTEAIIMIDDFEVPGDSYNYDDYGPGAALSASYLDAMERTDIYRFYPSLPASSETGAKRGCVVLCNDLDARDRLSKLESLRPG
ncbi:hypothetical protein H7J51_22990 [Mycobacterium crocinum]|uniref:Methyltransferase n=1 Tax=Mycolicibacterium crocinum TaxID=388459 RepID=A0ABY3TUC7_9MYCO|nr:hypothetical protein [Mycolicibacterium crocinum]MCV7218143.1 hypothetical protein [Mycolicibacterium crocinum]ULN42572.1 hypothetical protein MI149_05520 [Mycolicibacterium crocinum]